MIARTAFQASAVPPCSCFRPWVSHMLIISACACSYGRGASKYMHWGPLGWNKSGRHIRVAKESSACSRVTHCWREDIHFWTFSLLLWGLPAVPCWPVGLSTGGTTPVASPEIQLNSFSSTVSEENDAQENMCQKDSMTELGTEPRPSSPRTRYHSVAFPYICSRQIYMDKGAPCVSVTAYSCHAAPPSKALGQWLGTFLTGKTKGKRKT